MKLLTTAAALSKLGPDFRFKTVVYTDTAAFRDSTVQGNVYLKGFGNPDLSLEDLRRLTQGLKEKGIVKITGDLICDDSYFDDLKWGAGWMWDDVSAWYYASIGALTANDNCVTVTVKPAQQIGDTLSVRVKPNSSYMSIENFGVTVDSLDSVRIGQFKVERKWRPAENIVQVEGGRALESPEREYVIDVVNPALYTGNLFVFALKQEGIDFNGAILHGLAPDTSLVLATHVSEPLTAAVMNINKISDNLSAENLLKTLGAELKGWPGTAKKGLLVIREFFDEIGIDTTAFNIVDGSGLSRYNVVSPDHIIGLLKAMNADFRVQAEFKTSLPIAGVDGLLKGRMKDTEAQGKLRAKTGNLSGVSALSGYTTSAEGELLAFSMITEHFLGSSSAIKEIQDRIGIILSTFRRAEGSDNLK
jgi:PBP4 family serine-type D-alanyl-D-alanine carboxypeptidase